jgi:hypothetical protein
MEIVVDRSICSTGRCTIQCDEDLFEKNNNNILVNKCKCQNLAKECKCKSIVNTYFNRNSLATIDLLNLSDQSVYFHLNEELLHNFSNWNNPPVTTISKSKNSSSEIAISLSDATNVYHKKNLLLIGVGSIKRLPVL